MLCGGYTKHVFLAATVEKAERVKAILLWKYKVEALGRSPLILGCEELYDKANGHYSVNRRQYMLDLWKKYQPLGEPEYRRQCHIRRQQRRCRLQPQSACCD